VRGTTALATESESNTNAAYSHLSFLSRTDHHAVSASFIIDGETDHLELTVRQRPIASAIHSASFVGVAL
jgi:hypothetical protein